MLDEAWRSRAIEQAEISARTSTRLEGIGVLDPTCGSGTFLYHAARRILDAPEMGQLSPGQQADVTASLVHGIDVHPVAVEIAKTNMMRVLPTTPSLHYSWSSVSGSWRENPRKGVQVRRACADT